MASPPSLIQSATISIIFSKGTFGYPINFDSLVVLLDNAQSPSSPENCTFLLNLFANSAAIHLVEMVSGPVTFSFVGGTAV